MFGKKTATPQIDNAIAKAANFEVTVADMARRSERRAWIVAGLSMVVSLTLIGGYFYILPLKEKVPYMIMADAYTGTSTVARLRDDFSQNSITSSEAINKSNLSNFLMARESYDYSQIGDRSWNTVFAMSTPHVNKAYRDIYANTNPNSPITVYGKNKTLRVRILSIQLHDSTGDPNVRTATVRFQRTLYNKDSGGQQLIDSKIAAIEYTYKSNLKMEEAYRILNPLGFQVTAYRVDNDYAPAPPPPPEFPADAGAAPQPAQPQAPVAAPAGAVIDPATGQPIPGTGQAPPAMAPPQPGAAPVPNPANPAAAPAAPAPAPTGTANGVSTR